MCSIGHHLRLLEIKLSSLSVTNRAHLCYGSHGPVLSEQIRKTEAWMALARRATWFYRQPNSFGSTLLHRIDSHCCYFTLAWPRRLEA
jgi:hypothetical protein